MAGTISTATTSTSAGASLVDLARIGPALAGALHTALVPVGDGTAQVLASPPDPSALELVGAGLGDALVRELRESVPVGVVDLGRLTASVARETIVGADRILVVVTPDERATLSARAVLTAAARWGAPVEHSGVVVNRWNRRAELSLRAISRTVGCEIAAVVRDRPNRMTSYTNGRVDLSVWPERTPLTALRALAAEHGGRRERCLRAAGGRIPRSHPARTRRRATWGCRCASRSRRSPLRELVSNDRVPLSAADVDRLVASVVDDTLGFGPLDGLLSDPAVTEVIVNGCEAVFAERAGTLVREPVRFRDNAHLRDVIDRIVGAVGQAGR